MLLRCLLLVVGLALASPAGATNVLVVLFDDIGEDGIGYSSSYPGVPPTPNIDALAAGGFRFTNAQTHPVCTPSRASLLTGLLPSSNGVLKNDDPLVASHRTIADVASDAGYTTFAVGKWHLAGSQLAGEIMNHPARLGFDYYAVTRGNLGSSYYLYTKYPNRFDPIVSETYATIDTTNEAIAQMATPGPWLGYVAYHAAHKPWHELPPAHLYSIPADASDPVQVYHAMIEALDTEFGRLMAAVPPDTFVLVLSDNGRPTAVAPPPDFEAGRTKGSPYRGGIHVPFFAAGAGVPSGESDQLVHIADVFDTVAERIGSSERSENSVSLLPLFTNPDQPVRSMATSEKGGLRPSRALIRGRWKLLSSRGGPVELYDLLTDPFETTDLASEAPVVPIPQPAALAMAMGLLGVVRRELR